MPATYNMREYGEPTTRLKGEDGYVIRRRPMELSSVPILHFCHKQIRSARKLVYYSTLFKNRPIMSGGAPQNL